jgi:hypothetical protein
MTAPPRNDHAPDLFPAANAGLSFPLVDTMTELEFAPVPVGIHIIRNRGAPQTDCGRKNFADRLMKCRKLRLRKVGSDARGMNSRAK